MKLVLATANPDKAEEIRAVLARRRASTSSSCRGPADVPEVDETGDDARGRTRGSRRSRCATAPACPAVADDTGLEVDALGGAPGRVLRPVRGRATPPTPTTSPSCCASSAASPARTRTARFATVALARWPDGREVAAHRRRRGHDRRRGAGRRRVRVRPGVRAGRGRRPHLRRDDGRPRSTRSRTGAARSVPWPTGSRSSWPWIRSSGGAWKRSARGGSHRHRRVRGRPQGPRGRARVPRPRRAALRRELLAAPELGGRPPPRGGVRGTGRPLPLARDRPPGAARASRTR